MAALKIAAAVLVVLSTLAGAAGAAEWFVAPDGKAENAGTQQAPWDVISALGAEHKNVQPGDAIWLMGGKYQPEGAIVIKLQGEKDKPIIVRNWKNQRVTFRSAVDIAFRVRVPTRYVWLWGVEVQTRGSKESLAINIGNSSADASFNPGIKVINCVIHDCSDSGVGSWGSAEDEVSGCLVYNNGIDGDPNIATERGHCHGFYIQSKTHQEFYDNIVFRQFFLGFQIYGSGDANLNNVTMRGNTFFNNSEPSIIQRRLSAYGTMYIGGGSPAVNSKIIENYAYCPANVDKCTSNIGHTENALFQGNYLVSPGTDKRVALDLTQIGENKGMKMTDNTFIGMIVGFKPDEFGTGNKHIPDRPTAGQEIFVRPNKYEPGRANITIYNWGKSPKVEVDLKQAGLKNGDAFEIRDVQNFYADKPVVAGKFEGKPVSIPMTGLTVAAPIGLDKEKYPTPPHTAPEFGVFVVMKAAAAE